MWSSVAAVNLNTAIPCMQPPPSTECYLCAQPLRGQSRTLKPFQNHMTKQTRQTEENKKKIANRGGTTTTAKRICSARERNDRALLWCKLIYDSGVWALRHHIKTNRLHYMQIMRTLPHEGPTDDSIYLRQKPLPDSNIQSSLCKPSLFKANKRSALFCRSLGQTERRPLLSPSVQREKEAQVKRKGLSISLYRHIQELREVRQKVHECFQYQRVDSECLPPLNPDVQRKC